MSKLVASETIQAFLDKVSGLDQKGGDVRLKKIIRRIVGDLFATMDEFDVTPEEFWAALAFLQSGAPEFGLMAPGFGFDHFLDLRSDLADAAAGVAGGTPRTIEGPLYVAGAPVSKGEARLDDGDEQGEVLIMEGRVVDTAGHPITNALVDVWQANTRGMYSFFDPSQKPYNFRRRIETDAEGRYKFRSLVPSGYAVPPQGASERVLGAIGRHGRRPAHIHFFVSAPGYRHLTTQINIPGDPYLHDDFAHATRDELIPDMVRESDPQAVRGAGLNAPFSRIHFNFMLSKAHSADEEKNLARPRVSAH